MRRKAAARVAAALSTLICLSAAGCKRPPTPVIAPTPAYVRVNALLSAHPAWGDVQQIDALLAYARNMRPAATASAVPLTEAVLPPPLTAQEAVAQAPIPDKSTLRRPALDRVARLRDLYTALNDRVETRERKEAAQKLNADVAAHRATLLANAKPVDLSGQRIVDKELMRLQLLEIAYASQVRVLLEPYLAIARKNLLETREKIRAQRARIRAAPDTFEQKVAEDVEKYRKQQETVYDQQLTARRAEIANATQATLDDYVKRIDARLEAVEPVTPLIVPARAPLSGGVLPGPAQVATTLQPAAAMSQPAIANPTRDLAAQRARLVAYITDDLKRRIGRAAVIKNWDVSYAPAPGVVDMTGQAAEYLRAEFARKAGQ